MGTCEWVGCDVKVLDTWKKHVSDDGQELTFLDAEGTIIHKHISSALAKERGGKKRFDPNDKRTGNALGRALIEALLSPEDSAYEAKQILLMNLGRSASKDSQGAHRSIETAMSLITGTESKTMSVPEGEVCPTCQQVSGFRHQINMVDLSESFNDEWSITPTLEAGTLKPDTVDEQ